jgi:hypothetical protein
LHESKVDPPVLSPGTLPTSFDQWELLPFGYHGKAISVDAESVEILCNCLSAAFAEREVVGRCSALVGMAIDVKLNVAVLIEQISCFVQCASRVREEAARIQGEMDAAKFKQELSHFALRWGRLFQRARRRFCDSH